MNKRQKEVLAERLAAEKDIFKKIEAVYKEALNDIGDKVKILQADDLQSKIYQAEFQKSIKKQIENILDVTTDKNYTNIAEYLNDCYNSGFIGTMYDLAGQGIPLIVPINQEQLIKAVTLDSKISEGLYKKMGVDTKDLKKRITAEVSRGIATNIAYKDIARNLNNVANIGINKAKRIAQTEGHRIAESATYDAQIAAKEAGADVVKQWDATLDGATRDTHRQLDGQIREIDEPFEVDGMEAMFPGDFGDPAEDCNCRCASLQRARWALDEDELAELEGRAAFFGLDKTEDFNEFKGKYLQISQEGAIINNIDILKKPIDTEEVFYKSSFKKLEQMGVKYNPVGNHAKALTQEQIIKALGGGDRTGGSCASVGLAYIGQKQGWDVLDFRGGKSRDFFSNSFNLMELSKTKGIKTLKASGASAITVGNRLLKQVEEGKEYYLCVGRHASIVRKEKGILQYLELQSETDSGWKDFNGNPRYTLKSRFGCSDKSGMSSLIDFMIDIDESDFGTDEFKSLLGFINTSESEQKKGVGGFAK